MNAIEVRDLVKRYGALTAVNGVSFEVREGEVFALLGPNGAGKTTTTEIIEGLRQQDGGTVTVLGHDNRRDYKAIKQRIGIQLQTTAMLQKLTVRETVTLFASFFEKTMSADDAIALVDLQEKANTRTKELSGGQRQRLAVAIALINDPSIVFLDEPTTGLDPQARRRMWEVIEELKSRGKTVFLTTHYMEEAQRLCDRVAVMDHGKIIAQGPPAQLITEHFEHTALDLETPKWADMTQLKVLPGVENLHVENGSTTIYTSDFAHTIEALNQLATSSSAKLQGLTVRTATLEDVFLKLTGRTIRS